MNLHNVIANLIEAQNNHDSHAYAQCFTPTAVVFDEGKTHTGVAAIQKWIEEADQKYQSVMKPVSYKESNGENILTAEVSGTFPGSPALLHFHFGLNNGLIQSLSVTG